MSTPVVTIQNVSCQVINVACQRGDATTAAGDVDITVSGVLPIQPHKQMTVEQNRINIGQLANLKARGVIKYTLSSA